MKYVKYILFVLTLIVASCTIDDDVTDKGKNGGGNFRLMCRVMPFEGYNVLSRANGDGVGENDIVSLDYVILAKLRDNGNSDDYRCIYYNHFGGTVDEIITIDVDKTFKDFIENNQGSKEGLKQCYIAVLANYPELYGKMVDEATAAGNYSTINDFINAKIVYKGDVSTYDGYVGSSYFTDVVYNVEQISGVPSTGIPRLGNLKGVDGTGLVDITTFEGGNIYEVTLESLYAKMVFDINVDSVTQEIVGVNGNTFSLEGYTIHNLAQTVDMVPGVPSAEGEKGGTDDQVYVYKSPIGGDPTSIHYTSPREVEFTCYLPERYLPAKVAANDYNYPFASGGADAARPEDRKLLQRYKPLLVQDSDSATYVEFTGTFVNHQGHSYKVSYKIYVGNDNYSNFDVVRNRQYNNIITIKGIDNSSDQSEVDGAVSIDHRVDVQRTLPIIVSLRRETLLDSHFEVRPMRIRANTQHTGTTQPDGSNPAVKVEVVYDDNDAAKNDESKRWIGLERSYGNGDSKNAGTTYCNGTNNSAHGKRKYFTTDLTTATLAGSGTFENGLSTAGGQTVIIPVHNDNVNNDGMFGECVWIYVDECLDASTDLKAIRSAKIVVTNGYVDNTGNFISEGTTIEYIINQHKLFKIVSKEDPNRVYYIEHEEEYLHNFDADDAFGQNTTEFEGMEWGLYNTQLSDTDPALFFLIDKLDGNDRWSSLVNYVMGVIEDVIKQTQKEVGLDPKYDFYIKKHDTSINSEIEPYEYAGWSFCNKIISKIFPNDNKNRLQLDQKPNSAIEYCYNRNKRKSDGTIDTDNITWYLPAIDEMEDIMMAGYSYFAVFQDKFYWSCQPSYVKQYGYADNIHLSGGLGGLITQSVETEFYMDDIGIYIMDEIGNIQTKNVGRARSTKINYNSSNVDSQYENVLSGVKSYDNAFRIYEENVGNWYWPEYEGRLQIIPTGTYRNYSLYDWNKYVESDTTTHMKYESGNKLRSDKCRVRAVRKMTTTTTN